MKQRRIAGVRVLVVACLLSAAVAVVLDVAGVKDWRAQAGAAVATAVATVLGSVSKEWLTRSLDRRVKLDEERAEHLFMPGGKLPRVSDITDPISIGVRPAPPLQPSGHQANGRGDRVPVYVQRDVDSALYRALSGSGFVILVGDSTAGKTRTAFEAARVTLPEHLFIAPSGLEGVAAALGEAGVSSRCVLWLDNLQLFLGPGGLTRKAIAELLEGTDHHRVILATLGATEESRLATPDPAETAQLMRVGQSVVDQAGHRIFVQRLFSESELSRVRELADEDSRLADAIRHAARCGIGEYLACGPQLYADWQDAWARGNHPRGAALIAAAVDCRRAGFAGPLPRPLLYELHPEYLEKHGGSQAYPETVTRAWTWAVTPRESGSAPLWYIQNDCCDVFDYLIDEQQRREGQPVPESVVRAALSYAGLDDTDSIARSAWRQGRYELAGIATRKVYDMIDQTSAPDDPRVLAVRSNLAVILQAQDRLAEAEAEYRTILAIRSGLPDDPEMLAVRSNLAAILHARHQDAEAEAEYRAIVTARTQAGGPDHPQTLAARNNLAAVLRMRGRMAEAEAEYRSVRRARIDRLGADHPDTLITRNNYAVMLEDLGRFDEAETEYQAVLDARIRVLGTDHPHTKISRDNLAAFVTRRSDR